MKTKILIIGFLNVFVLSSCYYDREEELYNATCDTTNVTYATTVTSILNRYGCYSCHSGASPSGGFSLEGYNNVKAKVTDGKLFGAINHSPGFSPMPQGAAKMNECDINKVKAWINAGSPNN
jgi:hypothetical protein